MSQKFTPTQQRIVNLLSDGLLHVRAELIDCIGDSEADRCCLNIHLTNIRKQLRPVGRDVLCVYNNRRICYRMVQLLVPSSTE